MITVVLPTYLRPFADGRDRVEVDRTVASVGDALRALRERYPGVHDRIITERGELRPHVNVFVGVESIRFTGGLATAVGEGSELFIVPAVSGG
jgi:molybdopterin converting factor small subunit